MAHTAVHFVQLCTLQMVAILSELSNDGSSPTGRNIITIVLWLIMAVLARRWQETVFMRMASRAVRCSHVVVVAAAGVAMIGSCGVTNLADTIVIRIAIGKRAGTGFSHKGNRFVAAIGRGNCTIDQKNIVAVGIMCLVAGSTALAFVFRVRVA